MTSLTPVTVAQQATDIATPPLEGFKDGRRYTKSTESSLKEKNGQIWECVARIPNASGGFLFRYHLREEFDVKAVDPKNFYQMLGRERAFKEKSEAIYPAAEMAEDDLGFLSLSYTEQNFKDYRPRVEFDTYEEAKIRGAAFRELGYLFERTEEGAFLTLPDRQALLELWRQYRLDHPEWPAIQVKAGDHIETDLGFIESFLTHDVLLSGGKEFVHDHTIHLMALIHLILDAPQEYGPMKARLRTMISRVQTHLEWARQKIADEGKWPEVRLPSQLKGPQVLNILTTLLGLITDGMAAKCSFEGIEEDFDKPWGVSMEGLMDLWASVVFWRERYPNRYLTEELIQNLAGALWDFGTQVEKVNLQDTQEGAKD